MAPPPSPTVPIILIVMLITMLALSSMLATDPNYWITTVKQVQTHFVMGAFLIPTCLLLAVQVFGIPQVNPIVEPKVPTTTGFITQTTSILLAVVIFVLLMLIPLRDVLVGP